MPQLDVINTLIDLIEQKAETGTRRELRNCVAALAAVGGERAVEVLKELADRQDNPALAEAAVEALINSGPDQVRRWFDRPGRKSRWLLLTKLASRSAGIDPRGVPIVRRLHFALSSRGDAQGRLPLKWGGIALAAILGPLVVAVLLLPFLGHEALSFEALLEVFVTSLIASAPLTVALAFTTRTWGATLGSWTDAVAELVKSALVAFLVLFVLKGLLSALAVPTQELFSRTSIALVLAVAVLRLASFAVHFRSAHILFIAAAVIGVLMSSHGANERIDNTIWETLAHAATAASAGFLFLFIDREGNSGATAEPRWTARHLGLLFALSLMAFLPVASYIVALARAPSQPETATALDVDEVRSFWMHLDTPLPITSAYRQEIQIEARAPQDIQFGVRGEDGQFHYTDSDTPNIHGETRTIDLEPAETVDISFMGYGATTGVPISATEIGRSVTLIWQQDALRQEHLYVALGAIANAPVDRVLRAFGTPVDGASGTEIGSDPVELGRIALKITPGISPEEVALVEAFRARSEEFGKSKQGAASASLPETAERVGVVMALLKPGPATSEKPQVAANTPPVSSEERTNARVSQGSLVFFDDGTNTLRVLGGRATAQRFSVAPGDWINDVEWLNEVDAARLHEALAFARFAADGADGAIQTSPALAYLLRGQLRLAETIIRAGAAPEASDALLPGSHAILLPEAESDGAFGLVNVATDPAVGMVLVSPVKVWLGPGQTLPDCMFVRSELLLPLLALPASERDRILDFLQTLQPDSVPRVEGADGAPECVSNATIVLSMDKDDLLGTEPGLYILNPGTGQKVRIGTAGVDSQTVGLTYDPLSDEFIASQWQPLARIDPRGGEPEPFGERGAEGLALDTRSNVLYASHMDSFFTMEPQTGATIEVFPAPPWSNATCLAYDPSRDLIFAIGDTSLYSFAPGERSWTIIADLGETFPGCGLAYEPLLDRLLAVGGAESLEVLWSIAPGSGDRVALARFDGPLVGGLAVMVRSETQGPSPDDPVVRGEVASDPRLE